MIAGWAKNNGEWRYSSSDAIPSEKETRMGDNDAHKERKSFSH